MYHFDTYSVILAIATNITVLLLTGFVVQGHIYLLMSIHVYFVLLSKKKGDGFTCCLKRDAFCDNWICFFIRCAVNAGV